MVIRNAVRMMKTMCQKKCSLLIQTFLRHPENDGRLDELGALYDYCAPSVIKVIISIQHNALRRSYLLCKFLFRHWLCIYIYIYICIQT